MFNLIIIKVETLNATSKFEMELQEFNVRPQRGRMFIKYINYKHTTPLGSNNKKKDFF